MYIYIYINRLECDHPCQHETITEEKINTAATATKNLYTCIDV